MQPMPPPVLLCFGVVVWGVLGVDRYKNLPSWQKNESPFYPTNIKYMDDLIKNGPPPSLEISFTTRFNAFLNPKQPFNCEALDRCSLPPHTAVRRRPLVPRPRGSSIHSTTR